MQPLQVGHLGTLQTKFPVFLILKQHPVISCGKYSPPAKPGSSVPGAEFHLWANIPARDRIIEYQAFRKRFWCYGFGISYRHERTSDTNTPFGWWWRSIPESSWLSATWTLSRLPFREWVPLFLPNGSPSSDAHQKEDRILENMELGGVFIHWFWNQVQKFWGKNVIPLADSVPSVWINLLVCKELILDQQVLNSPNPALAGGKRVEAVNKCGSGILEGIWVGL